MFLTLDLSHPENHTYGTPIESGVHCRGDGVGEPLLGLKTIAHGPPQQVLLENDPDITSLFDNRRFSSFVPSNYSCLLGGSSRRYTHPEPARLTRSDPPPVQIQMTRHAG